MRIKDLEDELFLGYCVNGLSAEKRERTIQVLHTSNPSHDMKVGAINTLYHAGISAEDITRLLCTLGIWYQDYDTSIDKVKRKINTNLYSATKRIKNDCEAIYSPIVFQSALQYIHYFTKYYGCYPESIPSDPREAALYHISRGRVALPKHKEGKFVFLPHRPTGKKRMQWKNGGTDYSKLIMTEKDFYASWDWSNGVCLIVPTDWRNDCYLDIDLKSETHKDGMDFIDEAWFKGFHYEKTKSGGYHLFGRGRPQAPPCGMGLQLVSTLIVTYPSPGYTHHNP